MNAGSARIARTSALILSTIGRGVPAVTASPNQVPAMKPGRLPASAVVGNSGSCGRRFGLPMLSSLTLPSRWAGSARLTLTIIMLVWPPMTSFCAGVAPR